MKCPQCQTHNPDTQKFCGECGTRLTPAKDLVGKTLTLEKPFPQLTRGALFAGRYEIIEKLGTGGMGEVYKVEDKKINEEVALKIIKPKIAEEEKTLERFGNELRIARKIAHRNVCKMYDLSEVEGIHYITMEYVPGQDLKSLIRQTGQLALGTAISITEQICTGLAEAHSLDIVHRDLKPSNIMIDKTGTVRIMDFGIARSMSEKGITGVGMIIGTPEYMSPEQADGHEADQRTDIYSLGVLLYEMVTGKLPFRGETPVSIAMTHKSEAPPNPSWENPQIPNSISRVILTCLEKDRERRYPKAEDVLIELNKIRDTETGMGKISEEKKSIAVLPFTNMSPDPEQDYFCEGLSEELINSLTQIQDLHVVARTSAFSFKGKEMDVRKIGQTLQVDTVLEGSVRRAGNRLRITAQLIDVSDGYHLWSERYDRELADVFDIQDEITLAITDKLKLRLLGSEREKLIKRYTENVETYNLYLKGLYFRRLLTEGSLQKAVEYFDRVIEKEPDNALAYAGLAYSHMASTFYSEVSAQEAHPKARSAALKALKLDDQIAEAHEALAVVSTYIEWDLEKGRRELERAIALNPGYAWAYFHLGNIFLYQARFDEAIKATERGLALDPLNVAFNRNHGLIYLRAKRFDRCIKILKRAVEMDPTFPSTHLHLGLAYMQKSMYDQALAEMQEEKGYPKSIIDTYTGIVYARMGNKNKARQILDKYSEVPSEEFTSPYGLALLCFALNEDSLGFQWLLKAYDERDVWMIYIKVDSMADSVRSDPRFEIMLRKMGFE